MGELNDIGKRHKTDKEFYLNILQYYEPYLDRIRHDPVKVLEIGVWKGNSLRTWREYFTKAKIYGMDVSKEYLEGEIDGCVFVEMDALSDEAVEWGKANGPFDLIIEDSSHIQTETVRMFDVWFQWFLKSGGVYIVDDLIYSYQGAMGGGLLREGTMVEFLKGQCDEVNADTETWGGTNPYRIKAVHFYRYLSVIEKL